ncbi:DUF421 domain-containing protein [Oceanobacillus sp. Castelsardo]|uniref:DUF421 domain-containing protein n=1 Tax=Oceanobacillus sp. Castelsardo TaxID=1851204 RepID=UPI000838068D|nr:YetF domain-containing protein [Oceanobacillus sp. Castelsardo]
MIAVGTILIQPLGNKNEWMAMYGGLLLVVGMILIAFLQIAFPRLRRYIFGVPTVLIMNGEINVENLKKARMTMDELEMRLRLVQVGNINDVKVAVLEASGNLTVLLNEDQKAATKKDIQKLREEINQLIHVVSKRKVISLKKIKINRIKNVHQKIDPLFKEAITEDK